MFVFGTLVTQSISILQFYTYSDVRSTRNDCFEGLTFVKVNAQFHQRMIKKLLTNDSLHTQIIRIVWLYPIVLLISRILPHKSCTKLGPLPSATPVSAYSRYSSTGCATSTIPARKLIFATTAITMPIAMLTISAQRAARSIIAYVPQGNTLFNGTIAENLKMGNPDATLEDMRAALKSAAAEFVFTLPDGLDTVIGERGKRLSDGQAQRIAIARAIIRRAPLLILDEATSSLDLETESKILQELRRLDYHPTCIIVTHRESILAICNRKIVIEQGEIDENHNSKLTRE